MPGRMKLKSEFSAVVSCWDIQIWEGLSKRAFTVSLQVRVHIFVSVQKCVNSKDESHSETTATKIYFTCFLKYSRLVLLTTDLCTECFPWVISNVCKKPSPSVCFHCHKEEMKHWSMGTLMFLPNTLKSDLWNHSHWGWIKGKTLVYFSRSCEKPIF